MSVARETVPAGVPTSGDGVARETEHAHNRQRPLTKLILLPIRAYRRLISPAVGPRCRYYPSCSAYAEESLRELGPLRGTIVAAWRVLRCNPFSDGGLDPLSERRLFRSYGGRRGGDSA